MVLKYTGWFLLFLSLPFCGLVSPNLPQWDLYTPVHVVLESFGEQQQAHYLPLNITQNQEWVQKGREIVLKGRTTDFNNKRTTFVSKYFACTSCHNIQQEDPDLRSRDPEARLTFAIEKKLPFLQGTTFHGIVNRESWYNGDYVKKYGEKMRAANKDLKEAIQLCAIECAQGRPMEDWEIQAVLAYYWSLGFRLMDLDIDQDELEKIKRSSLNKSIHKDLISLIKSKYMHTSPATFADAPPDKSKGYGHEGNPITGKALYEHSCLHCHKEDGVSAYTLDNTKLSFKHLKAKIPKDSHFSLYQIIRYGTYALPGHRPYMPHYPLERMSNQQVEDLRAYIELEANF